MRRTSIALHIEKAPAGSVFHAIGDEGVHAREIAEVIGRHLDLPVVSIAPDDAAGHFDWMADFWALDAPALGVADPGAARLEAGAPRSDRRPR